MIPTFSNIQSDSGSQTKHNSTRKGADLAPLYYRCKKVLHSIVCLIKVHVIVYNTASVYGLRNRPALNGLSGNPN